MKKESRSLQGVCALSESALSFYHCYNQRLDEYADNCTKSYEYAESHYHQYERLHNK